MHTAIRLPRLLRMHGARRDVASFQLAKRTVIGASQCCSTGEALARAQLVVVCEMNVHIGRRLCARSSRTQAPIWQSDGFTSLDGTRHHIRRARVVPVLLWPLLLGIQPC
jgi:hypothetical protein